MTESSNSSIDSGPCTYRVVSVVDVDGVRATVTRAGAGADDGVGEEGLVGGNVPDEINWKGFSNVPGTKDDS